MSVSQHFSADYAEARRKFLDAAAAAGARLVSYPNPTRGPMGEELASDVALLGAADASRRLVTCSATHGVEGFCGSGIQIASFVAGFGKSLPADTALVVIHAINPSGFAWVRRVTEENVDLNRNFVDHGRPLPRNEDYDLLADAICPVDWDEASCGAANARLEAFAAERGAAALQQAVSGGQYNHPEGLFFGGTAPTAARRTLIRILDEQLAGANRIAFIDYHTGLGPYGYGEQIVLHAGDSPAYRRAAEWWGSITNPTLGTSSSAEIQGDNLQALGARFDTAGVEFTGMALEYGTIEFREVVNSLRADNWLHQRGDPASAKGRDIKRQIRDAFYCDKNDWKEMLVEQGMRAQASALTGLAG
jgi:hypothetical protein